MSMRLVTQYMSADFKDRERLSSSGRLILLLMCVLADEALLEASPGGAQLMILAGCSERQVQRCIKELVDIGLLQVVQNSGGRGKRASYRVAIGVRPDSLFDGRSDA